MSDRDKTKRNIYNGVTGDADYADDIRKACEVMRRGGVILYPTDTVWGIGCDATSSAAVRRVFEIKRRSDSKALITLVDSVRMLERYIDELPEVAPQLIEYSERPLTIIYDHGRNLAPELTGEDSTVGIRVTREAFSAALCRAMRRPIVSTSANISGEPTPAIFAEISDDILSAVDYVATSRRNDTRRARPSCIMRLQSDGTFKIIRP